MAVIKTIMNGLKNCLQLFFVISLTSALVKTRQAMDKKIVLITNPTVPVVGINLLREKGFEIRIIANESRAEILNKIAGVHALWWASGLPINEEILDAAGPQLEMIGAMSAGFNHIDLKALKKRGIKSSHTPTILNDAVADVAILLALAAARRLTECRWAIERDEWTTNDWKWMVGQDVRNSTVGILGLGGIGTAIVKRFKGFDVKEIMYTGHKEKSEGTSLGAKFVRLDTLLSESDFIIVAVPLTNETTGLCNADFFSKMKKTAIFINISRGQVVNQADLIDALKTGKIQAAGLDVMTPEPLPTDNELLKLPNVVLLPHVGSATTRTRDEMSILTAKNIIKALAGDDLITPIMSGI